jgi:hypothetical protein
VSSPGEAQKSSDAIAEFEAMSAIEMLKVWGLRSAGDSFKNPSTSSRSGEAGVDKEMQLVEYVQQTSGFLEAQGLLRHKFVEHRSFLTYPYRIKLGGSKEHLFIAANRHGQLDFVRLVRSRGGRVTESQLIRALYRGFLSSLRRKMLLTPFRVELPEALPDVDPLLEASVTARQASEVVDRKYQTRSERF